MIIPNENHDNDKVTATNNPSILYRGKQSALLILSYFFY